ALVAVGLGLGAFQLLRLRRVSPSAAQALYPLAAMATLGPAILYVHWPFLWHHPVERMAWYLEFHATHNHYAWMYLGELLREPPFPLAYVVVVTALTVPLSLLLPMVLGLGGVVLELGQRLTGPRVPSESLPQRDPAPPAPSEELLLVVASAFASMALISPPQVPHFGGVKHWFPSMPFWMLLAGACVARAAESVRARFPRWPARLAPLILSALLLVPAAIATARVHPYG